LLIEWGIGEWTSPPRSLHLTDNGLRVEAEEGSDFWQRTLYGFQHDDGHALLTLFSPDSAVEVSFNLDDLTELYDQAGLLVRAGSDHWIKVGVEMSDGVAHVGVVVTNGASDWSMSPVPEWHGITTLRLSQLRGAAIIRARTDEVGWRTIQVAPMMPVNALQAGPMLCAPTRAGFQVTFLAWRVTAPDVDLHTDPPR
jgi:regulation of enolase protein 1 (concanavalin A-like superfamily)